MVRKSVKITVCTMAAVMAFSGMNITADAAASSSVLPSGGIELTLAKGNKLESLSAGTNNTKQIESIIETVLRDDQMDTTPEASEEESFKNLVIAQVNDYVNVRNMPSEQGEIVGKLYDDSVGLFISEENGWYQISSGSVTGYVKAEYCVTGDEAVELAKKVGTRLATGDEAVELAKKVGTRLATVNTTTLKVRTEPSLEASVLGLVPLEDDLVVSDETDGWVQVDTEEGLGWVSTEFVSLHTEFVEAESKEEEEKRLAKEKQERERARAAAAAKAAGSSKSSSGSAPAVTYTASGDSEMGTAVADYALQFVGNPYVYGGSSLTNGTDCSGFVMSVYANFGVSLPHSSSADRSQGAAVDGLANAQAGDLICYSGHVALYIGNGQIVHASTAKTGIIVSNADYKKVLAVRRIF